LAMSSSYERTANGTQSLLRRAINAEPLAPQRTAN
jgi:hypothetical protein